MECAHLVHGSGVACMLRHSWAARQPQLTRCNHQTMEAVGGCQPALHISRRLDALTTQEVVNHLRSSRLQQAALLTGWERVRKRDIPRLLLTPAGAAAAQASCTPAASHVPCAAQCSVCHSIRRHQA